MWIVSPSQHLPEQLPSCRESCRQIWGISKGSSFTFVFQLVKLLAHGQAHDC